MNTSLKTSSSSRKKSIGITLVFVVLAAFFITTTHYGTKALSAVRASVESEGKWTAAQNRITRQLLKYCITQNSEYYDQAQKQLSLHQGFQKARRALTTTPKNERLAAEGFQAAGIHPEDTDLLIWLGVNFHSFDHVEEAFKIWEESEKHISKLDSLGQQLHRTIQQGQLDRETKNKFVTNITSLDENFDLPFSTAMEGLARKVRDLIFWIVISTGILLLVTGYLITRRFFGEINDLNRQLTEREKQFRTVLNHARDVIYELEISSGEYKYISPHIEQQLGYPIDQILKGGKQFILDRIHPDDVEKVRQKLKEIKKGDGNVDHFEVDYRIKTKERGYIWVNAQRSLIRNKKGEPVSIVGTVREISKRKELELQTQQSLEQKRTLLEEIHHRVKNNLAAISSILELQKYEQVDSVEAMIEETQSRIQSIATIHEKLYQTKTLSEIDIQEYIRDFSEVIFDTFRSSQSDVIITKDLQRFSLDADKAVPVGLILNELLSNALKHGFTDGEEGEIKVSIKKQEGEAILSVADNGNPLPDNFSLEASGSLGMTLIHTLTKQLEGELEITQNKWTTFEIRFPIVK